MNHSVQVGQKQKYSGKEGKRLLLINLIFSDNVGI